MQEKKLLTAICAFEKFGPVRTRLLYSYFKSALKIWQASRSDLLKVGLSRSLTDLFVSHRKNFDLERYFQNLDKYAVKAITIFEKEYPENLKELTDAPMVLYIKGKIRSSDYKAVAIVGSRLMTPYGKKVTAKLTDELAKQKITIVSGLALGVDAQAHRSALCAGGRTIAVLASGLDIISPLTNRNLALDFIKGNGALLSEYPLGHTPSPTDFALRNRLIAGLAKAVIVTEARMKSGTFYTVKAALDQGKQVFAVPGPIDAPSSEGTNFLIQNGAKLTTSVKDILEELHFKNVR